jgi:hypothetical protein
VLVTTDSPEVLLALASRNDVPARVVGTTGGARLRIGAGHRSAWIDAEVASLERIWSRGLTRQLEGA